MKDRILLFLERYFLGLARVVLRKYKPVIIGITGSVGKTTTKEAIAHVLTANGLSVRKTAGNLNADLGIALTVLGFNHSPAFYEWPGIFILAHINFVLLLLGIHRLSDYMVIEMGIDRIGDMGRMVQSVQPKIGVITWIGEGHHLEYLKDPQTIAREKGQMLTVLPKNGLAVIPAKDPQVDILEKLARGKVKKVEATGPDALAEVVRTIGEYLGLQSDKVEAALTTYEPPKGRQQRLVGMSDSLILDDSYNSSLPAAKFALELLAQQPAKRRIAVLGDILEQGDYEAEVHRKVAALAKQKTDLFVGVGKRMQAVKPDLWFASPDEAARELPQQIRSGDVVLVKGSQGMRLEKVSFALANNKAEAEKKLPRQNTRWQQIPFKNP